MELLRIIFTSVFSLIILLILTKLLGYRQLTQLSFFDYIIGITIGSIAAEMATDLEMDWWQPVVAMVIYGVAAYVLSLLAQKSIKVRRVLVGEPVILIYNGKLLYPNIKKVHYEINDLLAEARCAGYFDLSEIAFAVMENNGKLSFLPTDENKPCVHKDMNIKAEKSALCANLVMDGKIMPDSLKSMGKNEIWLKEQLKEMNLSPKDLLLVTYDGTTLKPYKYEPDQHGNDIFM